MDINTPEFDAYVATEGWHKIQDVVSMEKFLRQAVDRFREFTRLPDQDFENKSLMQQRAWCVLEEQFVGELPDLRMFFTETPDFYDLPRDERKRLLAFADALVNSGRDDAKYAAAMSTLNPVPYEQRLPALSKEQRDALIQFRDANGSDWKPGLIDAWSTSLRGIPQADLLLQVRETFGVRWLKQLTSAELEPAAHSEVIGDEEVESASTRIHHESQ